MEDVQKQQAEIAMPIDRVGIKGIRLPIIVRDRESGIQNTVAEVSLSVDLPAEFKGTHMSRFVEALEHWSGDLDYTSFRTLLDDVVVRLQAKSAHVRFVFPFFLRKQSPESGHSGLMDYTCRVDGWMKDGKLTFTLGADVPVMTVCPCSKAISEEGAHSQRAKVRIRTQFDGFSGLRISSRSARRPGRVRSIRCSSVRTRSTLPRLPLPIPCLSKTWCAKLPTDWRSTRRCIGIASRWRASNPFTIIPHLQ